MLNDILKRIFTPNTLFGLKNISKKPRKKCLLVLKQILDNLFVILIIVL